MAGVGSIICYGLIGAAGVGFLWLIAEAHNALSDPDLIEEREWGDVPALHDEIKAPGRGARGGKRTGQEPSQEGLDRTHSKAAK